MAEYPHVKLIQEAEVVTRDLPYDLQSKIKVFNLHKGKKTPEENSIASLAIAQEIYTYLESQNSGAADDSKKTVEVEPAVPVVVTVEPHVVAPVVVNAEPPVNQSVTVITPDNVSNTDIPVITPVVNTEAPVVTEAPNVEPVKKKRFVPLLGWVD